MSKDPDTSVVNETWLRELSCAGAVMDQLAQRMGFLVQCCTVLNWHLHLHIVRITLVWLLLGKLSLGQHRQMLASSTNTWVIVTCMVLLVWVPKGRKFCFW